MAFLFFPNPISIAIALIGANLPDFDHDIKKINLYKMEIIGLLFFIILYIAKLPYFIGIILCILPIIFYYSNHRGFTHSLLGIIILSILIFCVVVMAVNILSPFLNSFDLMNMGNGIFPFNLLAMSLIVIILAVLTLNKKIIAPFLLLFLLGMLFLPEGFLRFLLPFYNDIYRYIYSIVFLNYLNNVYFDYLQFIFNYKYYMIAIFIFLPLFLGFFSHLILDALTPAGIKLFAPFSSKKFHKKFALLSLVLISILFFTILAILNWNLIFA
ncbi:metal-dependent hydrolase [Methanobrevibacter sp. TMH8]|nr:metal-dependent hydrolase [Methanobrevibacter sp. TMH8]MBZ9571384.1 metal-dependent hydrolase [Methanobrevibacter sp. TMH8]